MISLIICSRKSDISNSLKENIERTIGTDYELIVIDNSTNKYSIFSAYNEGVRRSKGDILCFMHEDILYKTENWGPLLLNFFKNYSDVGCIGILGGNYMPKKPGYILDTRIMSGHYLNHGKMTLFNSYMNQGCTEVVALDGVWFCIPKYLFELISFDEINYSGFHFYDMDISMQVRDVGYKVMVMDSIYIEHNNVQRINGMQLLIDNSITFVNKWESKLPMVLGASVSDEEKIIIDAYFDDLLYQRKLIVENEYLHRIYDLLVHSKAYRLGKIIIHPISFLLKKHEDCKYRRGTRKSNV